MDVARQTIEWSAITEAMAYWSPGEQVLVRIAHHLYDGGVAVSVAELGALSPDALPATLAILERFYA